MKRRWRWGWRRGKAERRLREGPTGRRRRRRREWAQRGPTGDARSLQAAKRRRAGSSGGRSSPICALVSHACLACDARRWKCKLCKRSFSGEEYLDLHLKKKHPEVWDEVRAFAL
jgi:hypothetical protein